ncbi:DUF2004 domain-containing protein [Plantibacter sp. Mn2098]|uniref:DUF2004 domain-containing protein n=1 Tax=Plantibacter sp. Mn2098 TaxID=3395266 RepID=UPI003BDD5329
MAIEHDYFGIIASEPGGGVYWSENIDVGEQSVSVDLSAPDESDITEEALDLAAAMILALEGFDLRSREAMLSEVDDRTSEVTEYIVQAVDELGESIEDVLVDQSGDRDVDVIRSMTLLSVGFSPHQHGAGEPFAVFEYSLDADQLDGVLLVAYSSDGEVTGVTSED